MKFFIALLALAVATSATEFPGISRHFRKFGTVRRSNATEDDVTFTLYNRKSGDNGVKIILGDKESIQKAGFDPKLQVIIATHGFLADANDESVKDLRKAFIARGDCNFIAVDWSAYTLGNLYEVVAIDADSVGRHVARFLKFLHTETNFDLTKAHGLGHDIGAHVLSYLSNEFPGQKIGRITGFNPTEPLFKEMYRAERLDENDADFVDVYHTSDYYPAWRDPLGTVDFYVNGGVSQPDCTYLDFTCYHKASYRYFINTLGSKTYVGKKCKSVADAEAFNCNGPEATMGLDAIIAQPGFYLVFTEDNQ